MNIANLVHFYPLGTQAPRPLIVPQVLHLQEKKD